METRPCIIHACVACDMDMHVHAAAFCRELLLCTVVSVKSSSSKLVLAVRFKAMSSKLASLKLENF